MAGSRTRRRRVQLIGPDSREGAVDVKTVDHDASEAGARPRQRDPPHQRQARDDGGAREVIVSVGVGRHDQQQSLGGPSRQGGAALQTESSGRVGGSDAAIDNGSSSPPRR